MLTTHFMSVVPAGPEIMLPVPEGHVYGLQTKATLLPFRPFLIRHITAAMDAENAAATHAAREALRNAGSEEEAR